MTTDSPPLACRCEQRTFHLTVDYDFRDGTRGCPS
jgi:hypothetical protein